jgi:hypothetical protein
MRPHVSTRQEPLECGGSAAAFDQPTAATKRSGGSAPRAHATLAVILSAAKDLLFTMSVRDRPRSKPKLRHPFSIEGKRGKPPRPGTPPPNANSITIKNVVFRLSSEVCSSSLQHFPPGSGPRLSPAISPRLDQLISCVRWTFPNPPEETQSSRTAAMAP